MWGISWKVWSGSAAALVGALLVASWAQPTDPAAPMVAALPQAAPVTTSIAASPARPQPASTAASVSASALREPVFDAAALFDIGFAGGLRIDADTRASLEAVMNQIGDPPTANDLERIELSLRKGLPREDAEKAIGLIRHYVDYVADVRSQLAPTGIPATLPEANAMFDRMDSLKARHFDPQTREALFGSHDRLARIATEADFVQRDGSLGEPQKKLRLDALRAQLPADKQWVVPAPGGASAPASRGAASG